jgi:hypothetical protein
MTKRYDKVAKWAFTCPVCGLTHVRGLPEDEREHARRHA